MMKPCDEKPGTAGLRAGLTAEDQRVLVLAPTGRDSAMTSRILRSAAIECQPCSNAEQLCERLKQGAGAILLADEALSVSALTRILQTLDEQETWSDIPLIVFPANGENGAVLLERMGSRANVTILERPVRIEILLNAVKCALRARNRQYETRNLLVQLATADREKDLFLATLSHELRTPLSSILGWCRLLKSGQLDSEKTALALEVINRNATAQAQLISDILSVSQIIAGTLRIEPVPLDLNVVIGAAVDSVRPAAEAKIIHLDCFLEAAGPILGDPDRLQQIIANVLSNAIKFTPPKGRITIRVAAAGANYEVTIRDTGKGIPAEFLPHVFDHFRQADSSYTRTEGGLGLGLAIVRHLVELHGGKVRAESEGLGRGATITIILPCYTERGESPATSSAAVPGRILDGLRVLAVDDDPDTLFLVQNVLREHGATVVAVNSSAAALEVIKADRPDVLVSDIGMPGQNGYDLLRNALAARQDAGPLPAIALTGYAGQKDRESAFAAGYQAHLVKPFEPAELVHSIEKLAIQGRPSSRGL
jgi:signal transduction histidine kinase/ActR/RegA family two-component response regulator